MSSLKPSKYIDLQPFQAWVQQSLPAVYDDSLSYTDLLAKMLAYLNNLVANNNTLSTDVTNAINYINTFFESTDFQEKVDDKLNRMASDGTLSRLIQPLFDVYKEEIDQTVDEYKKQTDQTVDEYKKQTDHTVAYQNTAISSIQSQQDTLKQRMDTFTQLPSGSTSGDAELQDIRVGANGVTYSTAGDAVRGQYSQLKEYLGKIIIKDLSWETSTVIHEDGSVGVEQNYNTSNFVRVYGNEIIKQNPILIDGVKFMCRISEYDNNHNFIRVNDGLYNDGKVIIGKSTSYIRFSLGKMDGDYVMTPSTSNKYFIAYLYNIGNRIMEESYTPSINNSKFIDTIGYSQKAMYPTGEYTPDDFSDSVVVIDRYTGKKIKLEIGQKYRVSIGVGYVVMLYWGNNKRTIVDTQLFDFVADSNQLSMQIIRLDGHNISTTEAYQYCNLQITKVERKNTSLEYDYVVAASNSSYSDKLRADLVCDGINDEIEINCAVNGCVSEKTSCNVLLLGGTYNIGRTHFVYPSNRSDFTVEKSHMYMSAICIQRNWFGTNYHDGFNTTKIHGVSIPYSVRDNSTANIKLSDDVISSLDGNYEHCIFSFSKFGSDNMGWIDWKNIVHYKNLCFDIANASKKIIGIDAVSSSGLMVENCIICSNYRLRETDSFTLDTVPMVEGSIGIRGDCGGDNGIGYSYIKSVFVYGMYEGLAITGEHFVIENCLQHSCHYGFTIGNYPTQPKMEHPITFIGNSVEQCYRMALFNRYGTTVEGDAPYTEQTIVYINGSTECTWKNSQGGRTEMLPIKEVVKGAYRGRIECDWSVSYPTIFEDGSGLKMKQILYDGSGIKYSN